MHANLIINPDIALSPHTMVHNLFIYINKDNIHIILFLNYTIAKLYIFDNFT